MTDLNAEFVRYRDCCTSAADALKSGNLPVASDLFTQALQMARQYSPRSNDEAYCLQGLAESYLGQHKFVEAKSVYLQLEQLLDGWNEPGTERRFSISLQLAKCYEKIQDFDQASATYSRALEIAEVSLPYGHQRITNLLESYANVLRFARKDPQRLAEIEQKSRLSRSKQTNPQLLSAIASQDTVMSKPVQTRESKPRLDAQMVSSQDNEADAKEGALQTMAREHPRIVMGGLLAVFLFVVQCMCLVSAIDEIKGKTPPPPTSPAALGKVYVSADNKESLRFIEHGKVQIVGAAGMTNARCYVAAPGWSEFIATMIMQKPNQLWVVPNAQGLREIANNKQLYDLKACPILDLPPRLWTIARACQLYSLRYHKFPDATTLLGTVPGITDKLSDGKEYAPVIVAGDNEAVSKDIHKLIDHRSIDVVHEKLAPSKIVCITMSTSPKMIIVATDSNGTPFKNQMGVQLYIALSEGELIPSDGLSTKVVFFDRLPKSVVISASAPDFVRRIYTTFLVLICVGIALALAGLKLKSIKVAFTPGESSSSAPHKLRVVAWLVWGIATTVYLYQLEEACSAYFFRG